MAHSPRSRPQQQEGRQNDHEVSEKEGELPEEIQSSSSDPDVEMEAKRRVDNRVAGAGASDTEDDDDDDDAGNADGGGDDGVASQSIISRALSRLTSRSSFDPGPPPDGGWVAWSQCKMKSLSPVPYDACYTCNL